jgi:DNA-binding transcriptional regulator YdaS (Cro superfamily)
MQLVDYIKSTPKVTQASFAEALGVSQGLVWQWLNGRTKITAERAKQIEKLTQGAVMRHELLPDVFEPPQPRKSLHKPNQKSVGRKKVTGIAHPFAGKNSAFSRNLSNSAFLNKGKISMANVNETLTEIMKIDGVGGTCLVDIASGMVLGKMGGGTAYNLDIAGAANTEVVRAKMKALAALGLKDEIEDILITLTTAYHLIRLHEKVLFLYVVLDKSKSNLAMARHQIYAIEKNLKV